jgi:transposase
MNDVDSRSPTVTAGRLSRPIGEATALTKQGVTNPHLTPNAKAVGPGGASGSDGSGEGGSGEKDHESRTTVVQFSLLFDGDEEKFAHLWAMRDSQHRMLNIAFSEWRRAEKVPSKSNPDKETLDRGAVTGAVKALLLRNKEYWAKQLPTRQAKLEKLRVDLGRAKSKNRQEDIERLEKEFVAAQREVASVRVKTEIGIPSSVYDSVVRFTQSRLVVYKKEEFRGSRAADSFTSGQPIRWRDGSWDFVEGDKRGQYKLELELSTDGKKVRRGVFNVLPDGPSMHGFAKKMIDSEAADRGDIKLCDARVVYSEKKKQWFAKLTIKYKRPLSVAAGMGVAALRRGVNNAFVIAFENGRVESISGEDVLHFKRKLKARKVAIGRHKDRLEAGPAARGRGKARREQAMRKINNGEDRFVDWRCKTWAANIAKLCRDRGVGTLLISKMGKVEMFDGDEYVEALLYQWPFARMIGNVKEAISKLGVAAKEYIPHFDARRCPNFVAGKRCGHVHEKRQTGIIFKCEVCGFERPTDQIVALNGLAAAVGGEPIEKLKKTQTELEKPFLAALKPSALKGKKYDKS